MTVAPTPVRSITAISPLATKTTSETLDGSPVPEEEVRDENDHSWSTNHSRSAQDNPEKKNVTSLKGETPPPALTNNAPWTTAQAIERPSPQRASLLPPLGGAVATTTSRSTTSPTKTSKMMSEPHLLPPTVEARKPLTMRSDAQPADNNRDSANASLERIVGVYKDDFAMGSFGAPADSRRTGASTDPTDSGVRPVALTPPRPANARPDSSHAGSMASSTENHPSRATEERPPLDQRSTSSKPRAPSPNYIPRNPRDTSTSSSPKRRSKVTAPPRDGSIGSLRSARSNTLPPSSQQQPDLQWIHRSDPDAQEQALFEQRLCEDAFGVAVRKINQNGKSNLRYVKCVPLDDSEEYTYETRSNKSASNKSVGSLVRSLSRRSHQGRDPSVDGSQPRGVGGDDMSHRNLIANTLNNRKRALTWGKKKDVKLSLDRFVCVRKGKTTDRTSKNQSPASRLLSLITDDPDHPSLDIEAPTRLDRDKFARAFARFLGVPLETDADFTGSATVDFNTSNNVVAEHKSPKAGGTPKSANSRKHISAAHSAPDMDVPNRIIEDKKEHRKPPLKSPPIVLTAASASVGKHLELTVDKSPSKFKVPGASLSMMASQNAAAMASDEPIKPEEQPKSQLNSANVSLNVTSHQTSQQAITSEITGDFEDDKNHDIEEGTVVSSLTGAGFDQEIVEELHQALTELRAELESSRAEAARAVKVAEQAIQSAEKSNANDWNSTVTHKAAEAAAQAQKRSAEAIAKQRLAEDRLAGERRSAEFWRKQAEAAEEEAGVMQTRAAAAEVQRAAMAEELESERRKRNAYASALKNRFASSEVHQREALESAMERNRALEIELDGTRRDLVSKHEEAKTLQDTLTDMSCTTDAHHKGGSVRKKLGFIGRKGVKNSANDKRDATSLLGNEDLSSSNNLPKLDVRDSGSALEPVNAESVLKLHAEASAVRQQFELLRRATADELRTLPDAAAHWVGQASEELTTAQSENLRLREKLALESAARRKLLHEVQDLRGTVRVYCRPRPYFGPLSPKPGRAGVVSLPSQETILLHRDCVVGSKDIPEHVRPMSFEFDRVFEPDTKQTEVYSEVEELVLSVLDGYNVCLMTYGQKASGKTYTLLGDVKEITEAGAEEPTIDISNPGIQLQAAQQLFTVSEHRNARYEDSFSLTIVEVHNERLCDLVIGTKIGEDRGQIVLEETVSGGSRKGSVRSRSRANTEDDHSSFSQQGTSACSKSGKPNKLEIRTNLEGDIVVQGLVSVPVESFDDVYQVWEQCLRHRALRLAEQGVDKAEHEATSHVIATLKVLSTNIATGITTVGKIQFADLAGADLVQVPRKPPSSSKSKTSSTDGMLAGVGNANEWRFANKSLSTLTDVVNAQCQYSQNVPYRNSTVTHLLRDSLQADTKVLMVVCVSSDPKNLQETACALRFASKMKRVHIGKATKHTVSSP